MSRYRITKVAKQNKNNQLTVRDHTQITNCDYCLNEISDVLVACVECSNVFLCFKCFGYGAECGNHRCYHPFKIHVKSINNCVVFMTDTDRWSYSEEISLLRAVEQFGYGNWDNISEFVNTKPGSECRSHFNKYYLSGAIRRYITKELNIRKLSIIDHTPSIEDSVFLPPILMSESDKKLIGFLPLRDDYEWEFKNDTERLLNNLILDEIEDKLDDNDSRSEAVSVYLGVLNERQKLKRHARLFGLLSFGLSKLSNGKCDLMDNDVPAQNESIPTGSRRNSRFSLKRSKNCHGIKISKQKVNEDGTLLIKKKGRPRKTDIGLKSSLASKPSVNAFSRGSHSVIHDSALNQGKRRHSLINDSSDTSNPKRKQIKDNVETSHPLITRARRLSNSKYSFPSGINYEGLTDDEKKALVDKYK